MIEAGVARRDRRPLLVGRQLPRGAPGSRVRRRRARRGCRCACTRTSSCRARCSSIPATPSSCCRPPRATSSATAAPRPPPSAASPSAPRSPGHAGRRGAQRVGDLRRPRPSRRSRRARTSWRSTRVRRSATRSRASCRRTRESSRSTRPATRSSGVARASATAGTSRPPTARRTSLRSRPTERDVPEGSVPAQHPARASSSTRWCTRERDPLTGAMRDALFMAADDAAALGLRRR